MGFTEKWGKCAGDYGEGFRGQGPGKGESLSMSLLWMRSVGQESRRVTTSYIDGRFHIFIESFNRCY